MVVEYKPDEQAIFEINPYYHGKNHILKKWTWVLLDENTALAALNQEMWIWILCNSLS